MTSATAIPMRGSISIECNEQCSLQWRNMPAPAAAIWFSRFSMDMQFPLFPEHSHEHYVCTLLQELNLVPFDNRSDKERDWRISKEFFMKVIEEFETAYQLAPGVPLLITNAEAGRAGIVIRILIETYM